MSQHDALKQEIRQRIAQIQTMMSEADVAVLLIAGQGAPDGFGAVRYITNAHLWSGFAFAVLTLKDPHPWLTIESSYQVAWTIQNTTTLPERVEAPIDLLGRTCALVSAHAPRSRRVGMVHCSSKLPERSVQRIRSELPQYQFIDLSEAYDALRMIKSPFEIGAMRAHGATLHDAIEHFAAHAKPGVRYAEACASTEAFVKSTGAFWGRCKLSLDGSPFTIPQPPDRRIERGDVINFEIVYESNLGYWLELTSVFAFEPLKAPEAGILDGYINAAMSTARLLRPGTTFADISTANDTYLRDAGFPVDGKHTPDCHPIGLDGVEGLSSAAAPTFELKENMVLSFHPGTVLAENRGYLISDNFLVTSTGGVRLSPHTADTHFRLLDA